MRFVNVREFKLRATQLLKANEEVVITRYGKPIARLVPTTEQAIGEILEEMGQIFQDAGITKKQALDALEEVRREKRAAQRRADAPRRRAAA